MERLHRSGWISSQALEDARAAYESARGGSELARRQIAVARASRAVTGRNLDDTIVRAPFAGVVTIKAAQVGEIVSPISAGGGFTRTGIGTIVDMGSLEVEVDVAEGYINRVRPGMPATVRLNAYPDWTIPAEVAAVIPTGDRSKATIKVRIRFTLQDRRIIPEMGAKVSFLNSAPDRRQAPKGVAEIPSEAVIALPDGAAAVFVVDENLTLERRVVRLGRKDGDRQLVTGGVAAGERIVAGRPAGLRHGMRVRVNED
ncbi:MAG TPA: efflux RND transporter periplasmic adaptor subunit [Terriglobales bacterium]|nr:efflux RND transporter periplasmic adaptor subunit [Terriglobales bacterium]